MIYYDDFKVADELHFYQLSLGNVAFKSYSTHQSITLKDDLCRYADGAYFTTKDRDLDQNPSNCATSYAGAWWFKSCFRFCPNCSKKERIFNGGSWPLVSETTMAVKKIQ